MGRAIYGPGRPDDLASSYSAALGAGQAVTMASAYHCGLVLRRRAGVIGIPLQSRRTIPALDRTNLDLS